MSFGVLRYNTRMVDFRPWKTLVCTTGLWGCVTCMNCLLKDRYNCKNVGVGRPKKTFVNLQRKETGTRHSGTLFSSWERKASGLMVYCG
ncbi:hypothetical protein TNCV_517851 [Trichonephila clavipes]|nr:hypothetical protein TNCV_517851 [Trichonephila clavipes]